MRLAAADLLDDFVGAFVPNERDRILVPVFNPGGDGLDQVSEAGKDASTEPALGEFGEPPLDQVQPARTGGREMKEPAIPFGMLEPVGDLRGGVG